MEPSQTRLRILLNACPATTCSAAVAASQRDRAQKRHEPEQNSHEAFADETTYPIHIYPAMAPCNRCGYPRSGRGRGTTRASKRVTWGPMSKQSRQASAPALRAAMQRRARWYNKTKRHEMKHEQREQLPKPASVVLCRTISAAEHSEKSCS